MALKSTKAEVWAVSIDDRSGGVADKLEPLAKAGANFEMVFARRTPENPGKGMLFVTPVKGAKGPALPGKRAWARLRPFIPCGLKARTGRASVPRSRAPSATPGSAFAASAELPSAGGS